VAVLHDQQFFLTVITDSEDHLMVNIQLNCRTYTFPQQTRIVQIRVTARHKAVRFNK